MDVSEYYLLDPVVQTVSNRFFIQSQINMRDFAYDIFEFEEETKETFFEISHMTDTAKRTRVDTPLEDQDLFVLFLRADNMSKLYKREDYQLLDYLGDLGGILDFVIVFCYGLSHVFVQRLF